MKRALLCGVAIAALWAAAGLAQPARPDPTRYNSEPAITPAQQDAARQAAEQRAREEARFQSYLQQMTPEARAEYEAFAQRQVNEMLSRHNIDSLNRRVARDTEIFVSEMEPSLLDSDAFNRDRSAQLTDRQFGESAAKAIVKIGVSSNILIRNQIDNFRPLLKDMVETYSAIAKEAERLVLQSNPNMSQRDRDQLRYDVRRAENTARHFDSRMDEIEYKLRDTESRLREAEGRIADILTQQAGIQGHDLSQWQQPEKPAPAPPRTQPSPSPAPATPQAQAPSAPPAPPAPKPPTTSGTTPRKGTIPPADPYAALRGNMTPTRPGRIIQLPDGTYTQEFPQDPALQAKAAPTATATPAHRPQISPSPQPSPSPPPTVDMAARIAQHQREAFLAQLRDQASWMEQEFRRNNPHLPWEEVTTKIEIKYDPAHLERSKITITVVPANQRTLNTGNTRSLLGGSGDDGGSGADWAGGPASPAEAIEFRSSEETGPTLDISAWQAFELGGSLTVARLKPIYQGWDPMTAPLGSSGRSLSSAGTSLSSAGTSLSAAGTSLSSAGTSFSSAGISPSSVMITPSSAPSGHHVEWGGYFSPTDPFGVRSTRLTNPYRGGQRYPGYGRDNEPALCGR